MLKKLIPPKQIFKRLLLARSSIGKKTLATYVEPRNGRFAELKSSHLAHFEKILGPDRCLTDMSRLDAYNTDWLRMCKGNSKLALMPRDTQELSEILNYCNRNMLAVCPQGGNTGLVGGSVPVYDEIIVSTRLMNKIINLDDASHILRCQSGCILQNLDSYLSEKANLMMPLDLGAKGSCHIGGNVATNAGGLRLLRYGSLKGNVLGLEAVLADGRVLNSMHTALRKDNTGYDLNQLFVGSEGTLGIISAVSILCPIKPSSVNVILVMVNGDSFRNVLDVFKLAKSELNEILSAFEFMDGESVRALGENLQLENPFLAVDRTLVEQCKFYCLAETHGSCDESDVKKIEKFYDKLVAKNLTKSALIAENKNQFNFLWSLRERLPESLTRDGYNYKYDISLPQHKMYDLVEAMRKRFEQNGAERIYKRCVGYGHLGDGNIHLNITSAKYDERVFELIEPFVYEWTRNENGSISAEHGLGLKKKNYIGFSKSEQSIQCMKQIKTLFDPNLILNPYKTIPML